MYKLYNIVKQKTNIKGFWKDKEGKLFIDNVKIKNCLNYRKLQLNIKKLFDNGEKEVFYNSHFYSTIEDRQGNKTLLTNCIRWKQKHLNASFVKLLLSQHNGLTIYRNKRDYTIEIWK